MQYQYSRGQSKSAYFGLVEKLYWVVSLSEKPYFRGVEILNFRRISATFPHYFHQISTAFAQYFRGTEI
jgi:hypothetical protein